MRNPEWALTRNIADEIFFVWATLEGGLQHPRNRLFCTIICWHGNTILLNVCTKCESLLRFRSVLHVMHFKYNICRSFLYIFFSIIRNFETIKHGQRCINSTRRFISGNTEYHDIGWRAKDEGGVAQLNKLHLKLETTCAIGFCYLWRSRMRDLFLGWCKTDPFVTAQPRDFRSLFATAISALVLASADVWTGVDIVTAVICIAISNIHCVIRYNVPRRRCEDRSLVHLTVKHVGSNYMLRNKCVRLSNRNVQFRCRFQARW